MRQIASLDNLSLAYCKASKGKRHVNYVIAFEENLDKNLSEIQNHLLYGRLINGEFRKFKIFDPKERVITVAPFSHRVIHHAIINVCGQKFENHQYYHSYACRKFKGSHAAVNYVQKKLGSNRFFLKLDIRKYFDFIDHTILLGQLTRLFKDEALLSLFGEINRRGSAQVNKGLPIGNLTSQYFANHYLASFDKWIKDVAPKCNYARYMDDMLIFGISREEAKELREQCADYLSSELRLELKISQINSEQMGVPFLGYRVFKHKLRLNPRSKKRFIKTWSELDEKLTNGQISSLIYHTRLQALFAFAERADIKGLKSKYIQEKGVFR